MCIRDRDSKEVLNKLSSTEFTIENVNRIKGLQEKITDATKKQREIENDNIELKRQSDREISKLNAQMLAEKINADAVQNDLDQHINRHRGDIQPVSYTHL